MTHHHTNNTDGLRAVRAALYMRVSTKGHGQTTETQALALRDYAAHRGFEITEEYRDEGISAGKDSRPALDRLMKDARTRKFDLVIVARFDRFARSVSHLLPLIKERVHMGISRARKQGKRLGRPKRVFDREKAKTMLQS